VAKTVRGLALAFAGVCASTLGVGVASAAAERPTGAPVNTVAPALSGTAAEHKHVKSSKGTWSGATPMQYAYAWSRCNSAGGECHTIGGAAARNYQPVVADVGHRLVVTVTASNSEGTAEASSAASEPVAAAAPKHKGKPALSGEFVDGRTVTVSNGNWKGSPPFAFSYEWQRCGAGSGCVVIGGATEQTYRVQTADIGHKLKALVTAKNAAGTGKAKTKSSAKVVAGSPLNVVAPTISGTVLPTQILAAQPGTWVGTPTITFGYQWLSCVPLAGCSEIAGATERTHEVGVAEIGDSFEVVVTATNAQGKTAATSPETSITGGGAQAPENLIAPLITGLAITGQTVHASEGLWTGSAPISYSYQWELCNAAGAVCSEIGGATSAEFAIPDGDAGHTLRVTVTAENAAGKATKTSEPSAEILGVGPTNTELPTVSGTATAGQLLTAASGKWSGTEPILYEYEWLRCNTAGEACTQAAAASLLPVYTVAAADVGHTLRVNVIASNLAGKGEAESEATALVAGVPPANVVAPLVLGLSVTGQTLTATEGVWTGTEPITYKFQWELCNAAGGSCGEIAGATKSTFTIPDGDAGHTLRVIVTAENVAGEVAKTSEASTEVLGVGPTNSEAPTISGTATAGQLLTASSGKWSGTEPILYEYEWLRCNTSGASCTQAAAPSLLPTYSVAAADVGHTLRVNVIAKNIAGKGEAQSAPSATVTGVAPANVVAPLVVGLSVTGQTLTATEGTWTGTEPISYTYQWQLCSKAGGECSNIAEATKSTFTISDGDATHTLRVVVTAKNIAGSIEKESATTTEVLGVGPKNTEAPKVTGTATAGQSLTASSGTWTGTEPILYEYEWLRCNTGGAECVQAAGASLLSNYTLAPADVGHTMRVKVIAKNLVGSASAESAQTATVAGVAPKNTIAPLIVAAPVAGIAATATEGTWEGTATITYTYQWLHCVSKACTEISGANKNQYTPTVTEIGKALKVRVTAKNVAGTVSAESAETIAIIL
jgi:hypothetical protein